MGRSWARIGLLGNPSDGYGGAVIACTLRNFAADVQAEAASAWDFGPASSGSAWTELPAKLSASHEAESLMLAAALEFDSAGRLAGRHAQRLRMTTTVPRQAGLAGSSAIVIASLRALCAAYSEKPPKPEHLAGIALRAEAERLGIAAGPQDRLAQSFEACLVMDFATSEVQIEVLGVERLPDCVVAWHDSAGESSGVVHNNLRSRFEAGEREVLDAMTRFREIVDEGRDALVNGEHECFAQLVDDNFDLRASILPIAARDRALVDRTRELGAAAKFCGSGGSILAVPRDGQAASLVEALRECGYLAETIEWAAPCANA